MSIKTYTRAPFVWVQKPSSKAWIAMPISYMIMLQVLTGLPKPESLRRFDSNEFILRFSEELFDYPFWLQDLSHLPLFFGLAGYGHGFSAHPFDLPLLLQAKHSFSRWVTVFSMN